MKTTILTLATGLGILALGGTPAPAAPAAAPAPEPSPFETFIQNAKKPVSWLTLGGDFRARNEYLNNALTLTDSGALGLYHEQDLFRFRARIWGSATVVSNLSVNARVSAEPREWMKDAGFSPYRGNEGMEWRYGIVDSLNVKWGNAFGQPLTLTVGRQDIQMGDFYDWWLLADGTPGDGSWTFFLDAARVTFDAAEIKTKFDLMYINQAAVPDDHFPTIDQPTFNSLYYNLTEQDEQGVVVYASNKSIKNTTLDGYFIYKNDEKVPEFANGSDGDIYTFGGKVTGTPADHWTYSAEGAYQFGNKKDGAFERRDIDAFGGKGRVSYLFKDKLNNQISLGGEYLSGDDPNTEQDEMFDLLWGRWPRWSELYIYSYPRETSGKIAQINNLWRIGPTWKFTPMKGMSFETTYNALFAPEDTPTRATTPTLFSGDGNFRGHYLQAILRHQFNKHLSAHLWAEFVWEGDYYAQSDLMTFLRAEIMVSF